MVQALDHALHGGAGLQLAAFVVKQPPRPLLPTEQRYYVPCRELPSWEPPYPDEPETRMRACVKDTETGRKWYEVPVAFDDEGELSRPCLFVCLDFGPVGLPAAHWLFGVARIRGCLIDDWCHSMWNIFQTACGDSGLRSVVIERTLVQNVPSGPWRGAAFHQEVKDQGLKWCSTATIDDPIFLAVFDRLARAAGSSPIDYGSGLRPTTLPSLVGGK